MSPHLKIITLDIEHSRTGATIRVENDGLGIMFSLAERIGASSMWHLPKSKSKRAALMSVATDMSYQNQERGGSNDPPARE